MMRRDCAERPRRSIGRAGEPRPSPGERVGNRRSRQKCACIGVPGAIENGGRISDLDEPAGPHDRHPVSHPSHDGEVMSDEQDRELALALQFGEQFEDLRLHRDVERGGRFVRHDHRRLDGECARDRDPLPLAAREFVRQARRGVGRQADPRDEKGDACREIARPLSSPLTFSGSASVRSTVKRGSSEANGS